MKDPQITSYSPITIDGDYAKLPIMGMTGKKNTKYLVLPDEYFDVESHILLDGVTLIPMQDKFNEVEPLI